jgi:hypothetical protein
MPAGTMDRPPHNIFAGPGAVEVGEGQTAPPEAVAQPDEGQPEEEQDDLGAGAASAANAEMAQLVQPTSYTGDETPPEEPSPAAGGVEPAASGTIEVDPDQIKQVLRAQFGDTQVAQQMLEDAQRRRAQAQRDLNAAQQAMEAAQKRGEFDTAFYREKRREQFAAQEAYARSYDDHYQNPPQRNTEDMAVSMGALTQALAIMGPAALLVPAWGAIGALGDSLIAQKQGNDAQYKQDWQHYKDLMGFAVNGLKLHATLFNEAISGQKADMEGTLFKLYPLTQTLEYDKMRENLDNHNFVAVSKQIENLNKLSKNLDVNYKAHTEMVETEQYVQEGITKYRADHGLATDAPVPGREYLRLRGEAKELLSGKGAKPLSAAQKKEEQIKERGDIYYDEWATKNPDATDAQKRKAKSDAYLKAEQDFAAKVGASADPLSQKAIDEQAVTEYLGDPANKDKPLTSDKMAELRRRVSVTQSRGGGTPTQMLLNTAINDWKRTADPSNPKNWSGGAVGIGEIFPPYDVLAKLANDAALAGKGESAWPEETMQMLAMGTIYGQPSQLSRLPRTGPARMQYENTLTKMMKERYGSLEQGYAYMAFNQERVMAAGAAAKAAGNITIRTETYRAELERAAQQVVDASARVPRTENPTVNAALNSWYRQTGNAEVIQLGLAINNLYQAYARMSNPTGTGVHDIDKQFLEGQINAGLSKNQVKGAVDQILREGQNLALAAWQGQVRVMQGLTPLPPDVQTPEAPEPGYLREQPPQYRPVDRDRVPEVPPNLPMGKTQWDRKLRQWVVDGKRYDEYGHAVGK